ncbi:MAG: transcriptional repressor LexA [Clostridia bacterium]|nr:transcriptional repressor LexA [Clostridia bacterium]
MEELTGRKKEIYDFIVQTLNTNSVPPSIREICAAVGLKSPSSVHLYLSELKNEGYIQMDQRKMRTISIHPQASGMAVRVPVIGKIHAGAPMLAVEEVSQYVYYETHDKNSRFAALSVVGDSMIGAGISDGDTVIVKLGTVPANGDIVAAVIGDEATVKRWIDDGERVVLHPENPAYEDIDGSDCRVIGVACALYREL